jgi:DNA-binding IclR family transcriptional regulator
MNESGTGTKASEAQSNQSLSKALRILDAFSADRPEWGIRELGRELGINPTTVYRLVSTLHRAGYLEQNTQTQAYMLGPRVMKLAGVYTHFNPLSEIARKVFESFSDRFVHNFYLGRLVDYEVIYIAALEGRSPIRVVVEPGGTASIYSTALGKVLLAYQPDTFIHAYLKRTQLVAYTPKTCVKPEQLWEQIETIRKVGFAVNNGEHFEDIGAVGIPLEGPGGQIRVGISLTYPLHLIHENRLRIEHLVQLAYEIRAEISRRYGGNVV